MNCGKVQVINLLIIKLNPANKNIKKERREKNFCIGNTSSIMASLKCHQSHESPLNNDATITLEDLGSQALLKIFWKSQCFCVIIF